MATINVSKPTTTGHARVLVVDDEEGIRDLLTSLLQASHSVDSASSRAEALSKVESSSYDLIITDLKLPDGNGMHVLERAKSRDEFTEGIVITGYASLKSATAAINLGISSYLTKPISLKNFKSQVDRALATRDFHLRSKQLLQHSGGLDSATKKHIWNMNVFYNLSRRLMHSIDVEQIMQTVLAELNCILGATFCSVGVSLFEENEVFAMPARGKWDADRMMHLLERHWEPLYGLLESHEFRPNNVSLTSWAGLEGGVSSDAHCSPIVAPMIALGKTIGSIAVFQSDDTQRDNDTERFLHVFSSLISPMIENAYIHKRTKSLAGTDPLTGVSNHRSFQEMLAKEIARAKRQQADFCLLMLDLDDFKSINDTYGHLTGDAVLKDMVDKVNDEIRVGDFFARYGGEEFMVLLPHTGIDGAVALAERIRKHIASIPYETYGKHISYTVSIGLSLFSGNMPREKVRLIQDVDDALYMSKTEGKNRVTVR